MSHNELLGKYVDKIIALKIHLRYTKIKNKRHVSYIGTMEV